MAGLILSDLSDIPELLPVEPTKNPGSVLFVCNHNVIRSPMGEALMRQRHGNHVFTASAGVRVGEVDPFVEAVMAELGVDMSSHEPKALEDLDEGYFDLVVTLSPTAHHVALERTVVDATEVVYWPSADPTVVTGAREARLDAYRDVRDRLGERIEALFSNS